MSPDSPRYSSGVEERPRATHRLFLGIPVPREEAVFLAKAAERELAVPGVRLTPAENLHVTLIFFGDVTAETREELVALTREIRWIPFRVRTGEVAKMGRTAIAVRLAASAEAISRLEDRLGRASVIYPADLPPEEITAIHARVFDESSPFARMRPHIPLPERDRKSRRQRVGRALELHVTVARTKATVTDLPSHLIDLQFDLERVVLYESFLEPGGSRYVPIATSWGEGSSLTDLSAEDHP